MDRLTPIFYFERNEISTNIVEYSIDFAYENEDESQTVLNAVYELIELCIQQHLFSSKNAVLLGSIYVDYAEYKIASLGWQSERDYYQTNISVHDGLHSLFGREGLGGDGIPLALFFPSVPNDFMDLELEQAFLNHSMAVLVNYVGPTDLDSIARSPIVEENRHEDIVARILNYCYSIIMVGHDGLGIRICTKLK